MTHSLYIYYEPQGYLGTFLEDGYSVWFDGIPRGWIPLDHIDRTIAQYMEEDITIYVQFEGMPTLLQIWPDSSSME